MSCNFSLRSLRYAIPTGGLCLCILFALSAHSDAKPSPKQRPIGARIKIKLGPDPDKLSQVKTADVNLPANIRLNGRVFPDCSPEQLGSSGPQGCPKQSIVGRGYVDGYATGNIYERFAVTAVNSAKGSQLLLYLKAAQGADNGHGGQNPVELAGVSVGAITTNVQDAGSRYAYRFTFPVPDVLLQPIPGIEGKLLEINVLIDPKAQIKKNGKPLAYATTDQCPSSKAWSFGSRVNFADGQFAEIGADIIC